MCLSSTAPLLLQHWKFWLISEIRSKIRFKIKHSIRHLRVIQQTIMISARLQWVVGCWRPRAGWRETALLGSKIASHRVDKVSSVTTYSSQKMNYRFTLSGCIPKCDQCGTMLRSKKGLRTQIDKLQGHDWRPCTEALPRGDMYCQYQLIVWSKIEFLCLTFKIWYGTFFFAHLQQNWSLPFLIFKNRWSTFFGQILWPATKLAFSLPNS